MFSRIDEFKEFLDTILIEKQNQVKIKKKRKNKLTFSIPFKNFFGKEETLDLELSFQECKKEEIVEELVQTVKDLLAEKNALKIEVSDLKKEVVYIKETLGNALKIEVSDLKKEVANIQKTLGTIAKKFYWANNVISDSSILK